MAEQSTSSNVNITDAVLNQSPVIKDAQIVNIYNTQPPSTSSSDEDEWNFMIKLMKLCISYLEKEGKLRLRGVSAQTEIPVVHPIIHEINCYDKDTVPVDERYTPKGPNELFKNKIIKEVCFQDLLDQKGKFISIVASAGSGKTVFSLRLAKVFSLLQRLCIHLKLMDANYEQPLTLRQLLLENMFPGHSEEFYTACFSWMQKNADKIVLILDGLDQAQYSLEKISPKINYNACVPVKDLVFNLCRKHFFPNSLLIITSRPHAVLYLPEPARPQVTYALGDLSIFNSQKLFLAFADEDLWRKINTTSSQMLSMCRNPLMLQMIISSNIHPSEDIGDASTPTRLFATVMKNLTQSGHIHNTEGLYELVKRLRVLAFDATKEGKVVLTAKQLRNAQVNPATIHDIVVQLHTHGLSVNSCLFEGNTKFFFCHQTFQEHLTASYAVYGMPLEEFQEFVETSLFEEHWIVVRRFVCGLMFDLESKAVSGDLLQKKVILKKRLIQQLAIISEKFMEMGPVWRLSQDDIALRDKLLDLYACVGEGKDSSIATKAAEYFPTTIQLPRPMNSNLVPGFCFVMKHVTKQLDVLSLNHCRLDANSFHEIASVIKEMKPGQIGEMEIIGNYLQLSNIDDVIGLLRVVRDRLMMGWCFIGDDGRLRFANQDERSKIQTTLNKIQTGLEVDVDMRQLQEALNDAENTRSEILVHPCTTIG
ncbi:protein NLRC5-like [Clavelina lepadiformis]|uniref:protein NLRC5-like n=1 Tax=Clavelina lepadiformis TaxID=159417 RepID=UPI004041A0B8